MNEEMREPGPTGSAVRKDSTGNPGGAVPQPEKGRNGYVHTNASRLLHGSG